MDAQKAEPYLLLCANAFYGYPPRRLSVSRLNAWAPAMLQNLP